MLFNITRFRSGSPALKSLWWEQKGLSIYKVVISLLISNNGLAVIITIQLILQFSPVPKLA